MYRINNIEIKYGTFFICRECQVIQNDVFRRRGVDLPIVTIKRFRHPQDRVIKVPVIIRLSTQLVTIARRQLCGILNAVQHTACHRRRVQLVCVLQPHERDRSAVQVLVRGEFESLVILGDVLNVVCAGTVDHSCFHLFPASRQAFHQHEGADGVR